MPVSNNSGRRVSNLLNSCRVAGLRQVGDPELAFKAELPSFVFVFFHLLNLCYVHGITKHRDFITGNLSTEEPKMNRHTSQAKTLLLCLPPFICAVTGSVLTVMGHVVTAVECMPQNQN